MDVEIFAICDAATMSGTKMNILGPFSNIGSATEPIEYASCSLAIRIRFEKGETGKKTLGISMLDASGKAVFPNLNSEIEARAVPAGESSSIVQIVAGIAQMKLPHFGEYKIVLQLDGKMLKTLPLTARKLQNPASPFPP